LITAGKATRTFVGVLAQFGTAEPEGGTADADDVLLGHHLAGDPLTVDVCSAPEVHSDGAR
jgi:hypothetical protein